MKRIVFAFALLAAPALAQEPPASPELRAAKNELSACITSKLSVVTIAFQYEDQIKQLNAQLAAVTKDRDDLKAAPKPAEPPK